MMGPALSPAYLPPQTILSPATQLVFAVWRTKWERGNWGAAALSHNRPGPRPPAEPRGGTVASLHTPGLGDGTEERTQRTEPARSQVGSLWDLRVPQDATVAFAENPGVGGPAV